MSTFPQAPREAADAASNADCDIDATVDADFAALHQATLDQTEVVSLRRKVEALEHALAESEAARIAEASARERPAVTSIQLPVEQNRRRSDIAAIPSVDSPEQPAPPQPAPAVRPPVTSAVDAWEDGEATFEERMAAREFFRHSDGDQKARRWLLDD